MGINGIVSEWNMHLKEDGMKWNMHRDARDEEDDDNDDKRRRPLLVLPRAIVYVIVC